MNYSDFLMLRNGEGVFDFLEFFDFSMPFLFCKIKTMNICLFSKEEIFSPLSIKDARAQHLIKILHKKLLLYFRPPIQDGFSKISPQTAPPSMASSKIDLPVNF